MRAKQFNKPLTLGGLIIAMSIVSGCQNNVFNREPVPKPRYVPTIILGDAQTLTILPGRVSCNSALPMQCVLAKTATSGEIFQIPYDWIEGLVTKPDFEYVIIARPQIDEGQGRPTGHWTLQNIVSQRLVSTP